MAPSLLQQRRTHNTLLFQKLLNLREGASPFTLILDTLEQSGAPVIREFARRAKISKSKIIFISFSTLRKKVSFENDIFISARGKNLADLRSEIVSHIPPPPTIPTSNPTRYLLIIDTLHPLCTTHPLHISPFLSSIITTPQTSLLCTYHLDIPLPSSHPPNTYNPDPKTTLIYLATAILTISSLPQTIISKRYRDKSLPEPVFGLSEHREGILIGMRNEEHKSLKGVVVKMELRRRSGRGVIEDFVLLPPSVSLSSSSSTKPKTQRTAPNVGEIMLLEEHPLYATIPPSLLSSTGDKDGEGEVETTFNLGLTEKQKRDREGVVLPYFDAQKDGGASGPGDGGRILYEMGAEDREDFDDEEDEI